MSSFINFISIVNQVYLLKKILFLLVFLIFTSNSTITVSSQAWTKEVVLGVRWDYQHKDTNMLCLQGCDFVGDNAWDSPHTNYEIHGSHYCVRASIAMIANYFNNK